MPLSGRLLAFALALPPAFASAEEESRKEREPYEAEFVASDIFRSGSLIVPLIRQLAFEGHYFGGKEADTGYAGLSWTCAWKSLKLRPGFGIIFGSNEFTTSPAVSLRWEYERKWFITQGLAVQSFRDTPIFAEEGDAEGAAHASHEPVGFVRPTISDGNHVSARWRRLTIGGTWEHIAFREGSEWKGGGRVAIRFLPHVSGILYVLAPGVTEWRGGILIHSREE
jgi:hypothetical protein